MGRMQKDRINSPVERFSLAANAEFFRCSNMRSSYASTQQTASLLYHYRGAVIDWSLTLVFYDRLHKHEYFSCHKTFSLLEGNEGSTKQSTPFIQPDHLKSNYHNIKVNLWANLELS